jgi:hypothetical protein
MYASPQVDMGYDISDYNAIHPPVSITGQYVPSCNHFSYSYDRLSYPNTTS